MKESSPPSFQTFGAATAVTENAGGEVESCEGGGRGSPRLAWSMPPGVGVLEIRAWEPAGAGDSGYFPRGIVPGPRSATRKIPE